MVILDDAVFNSDPDTVLSQASIAQVRSLEKKTRVAIETQKKELRARVGEQYLDLISAADCIIAMSKNANKIQEKLRRMQSVCDGHAVRQKAALVRDSHPVTGRQQRPVYTLAALIKSLADVPEQIWHALEHHRYLQAGRLYTLAKVVHDYLLEESDCKPVDTNAAFPVIRRQWDAINFFMPQIVHKATLHLRVTEQSGEHVAEDLLVLMLLDQRTYTTSLEELFRMRTQGIKDTIHTSLKSSVAETAEQRLGSHLRDIIYAIQRTLAHIDTIAFTSSPSAFELYARDMETNFSLPNPSSPNNTPLPAITSVFSPSTNAHLLVRYLPESVQQYTPTLADDPLDLGSIRQMAEEWLKEIQNVLTSPLPEMLGPLDTQHKLVQARSKVWQLLESQDSSWKQVCSRVLGHSYSLWDCLFKDSFDGHAKHLIDKALKTLSDQPTIILSPSLVTKQCGDFSTSLWPSNKSRSAASDSLLSLSSVADMGAFKLTLTKLAQGETSWIEQGYNAFETTLDTIRKDQEAHASFASQDSFDAKKSTQQLWSYFQSNVIQAISQYCSSLRALLNQVTEWKDNKKASDASLLIGRLARSLAQHSQSLPLALTTLSSLKLRSAIDKDPSYTGLQNDFMRLFEEAHTPWVKRVASCFEILVDGALKNTAWDDHCAAVMLWEDTEEDKEEQREGPLPSQATHPTVRALFSVCEEMQRIQMMLLNKKVVQTLVNQLLAVLQETLDVFLEDRVMTERGALQLMFDLQFMGFVLRQGGRLNLDNVKKHIDPINWAAFSPHFDVRIERFYLKQTLFLHTFACSNGEIFESNKAVTKGLVQQNQPNVLPMVSTTTRFTLLPIGQLTHASRAW